MRAATRLHSSLGELGSRSRAAQSNAAAKLGSPTQTGRALAVTRLAAGRSTTVATGRLTSTFPTSSRSAGSSWCRSSSGCWSPGRREVAFFALRRRRHLATPSTAISPSASAGTTELGAYLDPLADKLLIVSIFVALGVDGELPLWLVIAVVSRDILIVIAVLLSWLLGQSGAHPAARRQQGQHGGADRARRHRAGRRGLRARPRHWPRWSSSG